jgi:excisionase family DNA binding protein
MEIKSDNDDLALLSITKAAKLLKVGKNRIYKMINEKEIGVIELNNSVRIPYIELKRWQENKIKHSAIFNKPNENGLITRNTSINPKDIMRSIKKSKVKNE